MLGRGTDKSAILDHPRPFDERATEDHARYVQHAGGDHLDSDSVCPAAFGCIPPENDTQQALVVAIGHRLGVAVQQVGVHIAWQ